MEVEEARFGVLCFHQPAVLTDGYAGPPVLVAQRAGRVDVRAHVSITCGVGKRAAPASPAQTLHTLPTARQMGRLYSPIASP